MEKRKLRRTCNQCGRVLDVDNLDDWDGCDEDRWTNTVRWETDPFLADVHEKYVWMWLCGKCYDDRRDEI